MERSYSLRGMVPALAQKLHGTTKPAAAPSLSPFEQACASANKTG